jgi:hypothetical protein
MAETLARQTEDDDLSRDPEGWRRPTWGAQPGDLRVQPWHHNHTRIRGLPVSYNVTEVCDPWKPLYCLMLAGPRVDNQECEDTDDELRQLRIKICMHFATQAARKELQRVRKSATGGLTKVAAFELDQSWTENTITALFRYLRAETRAQALAEAAERVSGTLDSGGEWNPTTYFTQLMPTGVEDRNVFPVAWHGSGQKSVNDPERWAVFKQVGTMGLQFMSTQVPWQERCRRRIIDDPTEILIRGPEMIAPRKSRPSSPRPAKTPPR